VLNIDCNSLEPKTVAMVMKTNQLITDGFKKKISSAKSSKWSKENPEKRKKYMDKFKENKKKKTPTTSITLSSEN